MDRLHALMLQPGPFLDRLVAGPWNGTTTRWDDVWIQAAVETRAFRAVYQDATVWLTMDATGSLGGAVTYAPGADPRPVLDDVARRLGAASGLREGDQWVGYWCDPETGAAPWQDDLPGDPSRALAPTRPSE